jgi:hypothetical protein
MPFKGEDDHVVAVGKRRQLYVLPPMKEQAACGSRPARGAGLQRHNTRHASAEVGAWEHVPPWSKLWTRAPRGKPRTSGSRRR